MSKYISLLLYLSPALRQGIEDEKGPPADPSPEPELIVVLIFAPATLSNFVSRDGGRTISRRALGKVVRGCPPESKVSSSS